MAGGEKLGEGVGELQVYVPEVQGEASFTRAAANEARDRRKLRDDDSTACQQSRSTIS